MVYLIGLPLVALRQGSRKQMRRGQLLL
jgi:uncharacterized protein YjbJ (UPF0337 family)/phosphohistidine swiveling domain-containing protein